MCSTSEEVDPEKRYSQLPRSSIRGIAESTIEEDLPENVIAILAEDVNYRIRLLASSAMQFMRHSGRRVLTTEDVNRALESYFSPPLLECIDSEPISLVHEKEDNISEEPEINLLKECQIVEKYEVYPIPRIDLQWAAIEGIACPPCYFTPHSLDSENSTTLVQTPNSASTVVSDALMAYYKAATNAILGSDDAALKLALSDIQKNARISPVLPNLVNFVFIGMKELNHDIFQLTKLLQTIRAIVINPYFFIGHEPYLSLLVHSVLHCIVEPLAASTNPANDHYVLRDSAADLLVRIHKDWASPVNKLHYNTLMVLETVFKDLSKPFCCHYGAVVAIMAFGVDEIEKYLYPHVLKYMVHLNKVFRDNSHANAQLKSDARKVYNVLLIASVKIIQSYIKSQFNNVSSKTKNIKSPGFNSVLPTNALYNITEKFSVNGRDSKNTMSKVVSAFELYKTFYECFGDAFVNFLPYVYLEYAVHDHSKYEIMNLFYYPDIHKTDEELLEKFYENDDEKDDYQMKSSVCSVEGYYSCDDYDEGSLHSDEHDSYPINLKVKKRIRKLASGSFDDNSCDEHDDNSLHSDDHETDPVDLQVKSTVNDPTLGIKLTIAKRRRPKPAEEQHVESRKPKIEAKVEPPDPVFEVEPMIWDRYQVIEFNFEEAKPLPLHKLKRKSLGNVNLGNNFSYLMYSKWQKHPKITQKRYTFDSKKWLSRKLRSGNFETVL